MPFGCWGACRAWRAFSAGTALAIIEEVAAAAGTMGLIGGQVADLEAEGRTDVTVDELRSIHLRKTGALFRACVRCGALLPVRGRTTAAVADPLRGRVRLAFQIADDILDVVGDRGAGQTAGPGQERAKATYPALVGLERRAGWPASRGTGRAAVARLPPRAGRSWCARPTVRPLGRPTG